MSSLEEIENRINQTKNILHKCALEGQINMGLMLSDIEYLLNETKALKSENKELNKELNQRIKLKIENEKIVDNEFISKDKIKAKIHAFKEIKKEILSCENKLAKASITYDIVRNDYCEKMLKDLLEEE